MNFKQVNLTSGAVDNTEFHTLNADAFITFRHPAEMMCDDAANGVEVSVRELRIQRFVEVAQWRQRCL